MPHIEWKTLLEVNARSEAEVIKSALEAQGIQAELFQEAAGTVYGLTGGLLGQVEICVAPADLQAAQAWLVAYQTNQLEDHIEDDSHPDQ